MEKNKQQNNHTSQDIHSISQMCIENLWFEFNELRKAIELLQRDWVQPPRIYRLPHMDWPRETSLWVTLAKKY